MVDGEGYIGVYRDRKRPNIFPRVCVTGTSQDLADELQESFGGDVTWKRNRDKPNWKPEFTWRLSHKAAIEFLDRIKGFLVVKWPQCQLALSLYVIKKLDKEDGGVVSRGYRKGWSYSEGAIEAMVFIAEAMKRFNARGLDAPDPWAFVDEVANASG